MEGKDDIARELFLKGFSIRIIAYEIEVSKSSVHRFLKNLNVDKNIRVE